MKKRNKIKMSRCLLKNLIPIIQYFKTINKKLAKIQKMNKLSFYLKTMIIILILLPLLIKEYMKYKKLPSNKLLLLMI